MNPIFAGIFITCFVVALATELYGVWRGSKGAKGTTITEGWRWFDKWLAFHSPIADWFYRVFSAGFFIWLILHFLVGIN